MKRLLYSLLLAGTAISGGAQLRWVEARFDFGLIKEVDGEVKHDFLMINESADTVAILNVQKSCGCTRVDYPKGAILPGDTATFGVFFNPANYVGRFNKNVYVKTSSADSLSARAALSVAGTVKASEQTLSGRFFGRFGTVLMKLPQIRLKRNAERQFFMAYNNSCDTLKIELSDIPPYMNARTSLGAIMPAEAFSFIISLDPDKLPTPSPRDSITISTPTAKHKIPFIIEAQ